MNIVVSADVAAWRDERVPEHLSFAMRHLVDEDPDATLDHLASIPFYSLCTGLLLPLSGMASEKAHWLFGLAHTPPSSSGREALLQTFLAKDVGLDLVQKLACVLGDPYRGKPSTLRRDSLVTLLLTVVLKSRRDLIDRLSVVGDVAVLYAESRPQGRGAPPLTAAEVIETLRFTRSKGLGKARKFRLIRDLLMRCGKLEAYFLAKLVMRKAGFGFDYQGALIARVLGEHFQAPAEQVAHAMALTDAFEVMRVLSRDGVDGLRAIRLQPLVPVRPALASGTVDGVKTYPVWVERKYDGIRFMLHKSTDARGSVLCGAYTRNRRDWMDLVSGLAAAIQAIGCRDCIVDGELYGTVMDLDGARPATVYEVYSALQGDRARPVNMKFAAFDLVYLNGSDLTQLPLSERRRILLALLAPLVAFPLPVPIQVADGQLCDTAQDVKRLYGHFRNQGYEGLIAKDLQGTYVLAARDPTWLKRKPVVTLDLVLLGAVFAVTEKTTAGLFGSYVIGARATDGSFVDVGDVAGVDRIKDQQIQQEVMREGLITGHRIERKSASGVRSGMDLRPYIVVTVKFEGIIKDSLTGDLKLRDPKLVAIRSDKSAAEADKVGSLEQIWLRHRVG
jgi:DNA ligase-1